MRPRTFTLPRARQIAPLPALFLLAACADSTARLVEPPSATGGEPAGAHAVETVGRTGRIVLGLTQGSVRACSGSYEPPGSASPTRTTELACTGGVTGMATVGPDPSGGRSVRWQLETGENGRTFL